MPFEIEWRLLKSIAIQDIWLFVFLTGNYKVKVMLLAVKLARKLGL